MSNPFADLRQAVCAQLLAGPGVTYAELYDGEDPERLRAIASSRGPGALVRIATAEGSDQGPRSAVCCVLGLHVILLATSVSGRGTAAAVSEQLLWDALDALINTTSSCAWLRSPWRLDSFLVEDQTANTTIRSLALKAHADLSGWTPPAAPAT